MARTPHSPCYRRSSRAIAQFLGLGLLLHLPVAHAAYVDLANAPLQTSSSQLVRPNIMFILDNSGSMDWTSMTGTDGATPYGRSSTGSPLYLVANPDYYASVVNKMYYNPNVTYAPPVVPVWNGTNYVLQQMPNAATTNTPNDGYNAAFATGNTGTTNLSTVCYSTSSTTPPLPLTGTATSGNCRTTSGGSYTQPIQRYSFYHVNIGTGTPTASGSTSYTPQANVSYQRQEIKSSIASYTRTAARTDCAAAPTCTYAEEMQNFANWWSYYRTRINTMKTTLGRVFSTLNDNYNVGFSTINSNSATGNSNGDNFINVAQFANTPQTTAQVYRWYNNFYKINPNGGTPLQQALWRVGEYYRTGSMGYAGGPASVNPVQYSCQKNFAILSTDGYWNSNTGSTAVTAAQLGGIGDWDNTVPSSSTWLSSYSYLNGVQLFGHSLATGSQWPRPLYQGPTATSLTLADVALAYWATDLRPGTGGVADNNVIPSTSDPATWQHMTTFTIGLGASGTQPYDPNYLTATSGFFFNVKNGTANWPAPAADAASTTEDLWHAAVNSGGQYFNASDPTAIETSLQQILNAIIAMNSTSAAATLSASIVTGANNYAYVSSFNTGDWTGDVDAFAINPSTGAFSNTSAWTSTAQAQLDGRTSISGSAGGFTCSDSRKIATFRPGTGGVPFQWGNLSSSQQTSLGTQDLLQYLRGWRCKEVSNGGSYRNRTHLLGDIVNSEVAYMGAPFYRYYDSGYATFKSTNASRAPTLFVGSNDGMLHAFDASSGAELWAYVPNRIMSALPNLANAQTFQHRYYVDGSPILGDVDFDNTTTNPGGGWKTILVGSLRKGGFGYYALDVTNPTAATDSDVAAKVLWEFPNPSDPTHAAVAANVGYSFGDPTITKVNGKWVVIVTSGYDNGTTPTGGATPSSGGDGGGYVYVLDAKTGTLLNTIATGSGTATAPSGLARLSGYINDYDTDNTTPRMYGGDLNGDLWRFDLVNMTAAKMATLQDPGGSGQPITTVPHLYDIGNTHMVAVATGRYLTVPDITDTQIQSLWALKDDLVTNNMNVRSMVGTAAGSTIVKQTWVSTNPIESSQTPVDVTAAASRGWMVDFDGTSAGGPGERATDPASLFGALTFTTNKPAATACSPGGQSWLYYLNEQNGWPLIFSGGQLASGQYVGNAVSTRVVVYQVGMTAYSAFRTSAPVVPPSGPNGPGSVAAGAGGTGGPGGPGGGGGTGGIDCQANPKLCRSVGVTADTNNPAQRIFWREIIQ